MTARILIARKPSREEKYLVARNRSYAWFSKGIEGMSEWEKGALKDIQFRFFIQLSVPCRCWRREMRSRLLRPRNLVVYFVLGITLVVFVRQLETLYTVPVFDSVRWGGDETWLMREFGNQAHRGVMSYPESFGGRPRTDGVLAGSMWVDALLYGTPGYILFPKY